MVIKNASRSMHISGQLGIDPWTASLVQGGIGAETRQIMLNIQQILESADASLQ